MEVRHSDISNEYFISFRGTDVPTTLTAVAAQELVDMLAGFGVRSLDEVKLDITVHQTPKIVNKELEATLRHLEDMRKLALHLLDTNNKESK